MENVRTKTLAVQSAALALALAWGPAWAINKCTGPDGRVSFQDAPCAGKGEKIEVKPASGHVPAPAAAPASAAADGMPAAPAAAAPAARKEGAFGPSWQRMTYLRNRGIAEARAAVDAHRRDCAARQSALAAQKRRANNNLAGATWEQSISTEMQALATTCESRARELREDLLSVEAELRRLEAEQR